MKTRLREDLLARDEQEKEGEKDREIDHGRMRREEGKAKPVVADDEELIQRRNEKIKEVLGVSKDYQHGDFLRRMQADKEKKKLEESGIEKEISAAAGTENVGVAPGSNVVHLRGKELSANVVSASARGPEDAVEKPENPAIDVHGGGLSGSESSVLTPSSPSSGSLESPKPTRRFDGEEVSPPMRSKRRGGDVLLEESLMHKTTPTRQEECVKQSPSAKSNDYERTEHPRQKPGLESYEGNKDEHDHSVVRGAAATRGSPFQRDEDVDKLNAMVGPRDERLENDRHSYRTNEDKYHKYQQPKHEYHNRAFRESQDYGKAPRSPDCHDGWKDSRRYRGARDIDELCSTDESELAAGRKAHERRFAREHSGHPRRHERSRKGKRRMYRSRRARYSEDDDSYDSISSDSRSLSPRGRYRSPSPRRYHSNRRDSPPRKRLRKEEGDAYSRPPTNGETRGRREASRYRSRSRDASFSPARARSRSPVRDYRGSVSPRRGVRHDEHRRQHRDRDLYDSDESYRFGRTRRERQEYRRRCSSLSPRRTGSYRSRSRDRHYSPPRDRYLSPSRDRYHSPGWQRHRSPSRDRRRSPSMERHRSPPSDRYRSMAMDRSRYNPKDRYRSPSVDRNRSPSAEKGVGRSRQEGSERRQTEFGSKEGYRSHY
ncbi:unnamed protein product [Chondrus crispus]|uniref:Uncharacterized protein n=1 Tax=Chondrus crispus TaxID=2769 RepID=R7Q8Y7_CHOCR|nr:unnamed protein product [Chondrus crispus]CDF33861.1 unnamed protein product [Chondrus crispus]|eukprot:XP_005713680.1 unnamed protein product [Chondrus crispus]